MKALTLRGGPALILTFTARSDMINVGSDYALHLEIRDPLTGDLANAGALAWFVRRDDAEVTYTHGVDAESVKDADTTGRYTLTLRATKPGEWKVVAIVTGAVHGREKWSFEVHSTIADVAVAP